jgi:hypothetical protein
MKGLCSVAELRGDFCGVCFSFYILSSSLILQAAGRAPVNSSQPILSPALSTTPRMEFQPTDLRRLPPVNEVANLIPACPTLRTPQNQAGSVADCRPGSSSSTADQAGRARRVLQSTAEDQASPHQPSPPSSPSSSSAILEQHTHKSNSTSCSSIQGCCEDSTENKKQATSRKL